jgi:hypothetical protein
LTQPLDVATIINILDFHVDFICKGWCQLWLIYNILIEGAYSCFFLMLISSFQTTELSCTVAGKFCYLIFTNVDSRISFHIQLTFFIAPSIRML